MEFLTSLASFSRVGIDTPIFIYHLESHTTYLPITQVLLSSIEAGMKKGITSTITLMEITVRPLQLGRKEIAIKYEALLANFPNLSLIDIDRDVARHAAQLRARYNLRPADALQVAACKVSGAQVFITNDRRLVQLKPEIEIIVLQDFINSNEQAIRQD
jgi:predicted nucleic acid-binding protein